MESDAEADGAAVAAEEVVAVVAVGAVDAAEEADGALVVAGLRAGMATTTSGFPGSTVTVVEKG